MPISQYKFIRKRAFWMFGFLIVCFIFAGCQMYKIQITRHDELLAKARDRYTTTTKKEREHGVIYDYDGNLLVSNRFVMTIAFDPAHVKDEEKRKEIACFLERELPKESQVSYAELMRRIKSGDRFVVDEETAELKEKTLRYVVLVRDVDFEAGETIRKKANGMRLQGLRFDKVCRRTYPKGNMLANVLGFSRISGDETIAVAGLERTFREEMMQEDALIVYERTRDGRIIGYGNQSQDGNAHDGDNVYLTVKEPLQAIMEEELDRMYREFNPKAIYAAMADPYTGNILAIAQRPTFNPNDRKSLKDPSVCRNRIAEDPFEPGSVIKPFVVGMALDRGYITPESKIYTGFQAWSYAGRPLHETHYIGTATPLQIIQNSSNIGTAMIAVMMGQENLYNTLRTFHFGERTGLPLSPETKGTLHPLSRWNKLSVSRVCIGHEMNVTALQLLQAYCMLANGGHYVKLRLVDALENAENGKQKQPVIYTQKSVFQNPEAHKQLIQMMKTVTKPGGTSAAAGVPGFEVAGKTGTANKLIDGKYVKGRYVATFCGFVPADKPKLVMVVTCDDPQGEKQFGGSVSGPAFSNIALRALNYLDVPPEMTVEQWEADRKACNAAHWKEMQVREAERKMRVSKGQLAAPKQ